MSQYYGLTDGNCFHMRHGPCFANTSTLDFIQFGEKLGKDFIYPVGGYINLNSELAKAMLNIPYFKSAIIGSKEVASLSERHDYYKDPGHLITFDPYRNIRKIKNVMHWLRQPSYSQWYFAELMYSTGIPAEVCIFFAHQISEAYNNNYELCNDEMFIPNTYWNGCLDQSVRIPQITHWIKEQSDKEIPNSYDNFYEKRKFPVGNDTVNRSMFDVGRSGLGFNKLFVGKGEQVNFENTMENLINPILKLLGVVK